jgi:hypothetical protein
MAGRGGVGTCDLRYEQRTTAVASDTDHLLIEQVVAEAEVNRVLFITSRTADVGGVTAIVSRENGSRQQVSHISSAPIRGRTSTHNACIRMSITISIC